MTDTPIADLETAARQHAASESDKAREFEAARIVADSALGMRKNIGLLTEEEVAAILNLGSTGTLATWRSQRIGPRPVKLGKRVFYTGNAIVAWINDQVVKQDNEFAAKSPENQTKAA